ncbi:MAG TPA: plastocyanin/azurin family copper-binding protein, partial [Ktedonobacterales bacterium]|nr:plastocyanin/azurin family copper-binding protein [Ktedonobacterales bacterium]
MLAVALMVAMLALGISAPSRAAHAAANQTWHVTVGAESPNGVIAGMIFAPDAIYVHRGDTVVWTVGSMEPHTVSFGAPPPFSGPPSLEDLIKLFATPAGGSSFTGASYYNSGLLTTVPEASGFPFAAQQYSLAINAPVGTYMFYCLVHGQTMSQVVHVIADDAAYPFTQANYDAQAAQQRAHVIAQGWSAFAQTNANLPDHTVSVGQRVDAGMADVMRFVRGNTTIKVGETVTFVNTTTAPHTVTIGKELGFGQYGDLNNVRLGDNVNTGIFGPAFGGVTSMTLRFTQPGVYTFYCELHDFMGMVATITVTP